MFWKVLRRVRAHSKKDGVISKTFGPHLTLDLYGCDKKKLNDHELLFKLLDELPGKIGMHKFSEPIVHLIPPRENSFDQGGVTGFVILVESHISIHTFPADGFASIDIFSCKSFNSKFFGFTLVSKQNALNLYVFMHMFK